MCSRHEASTAWMLQFLCSIQFGQISTAHFLHISLSSPPPLPITQLLTIFWSNCTTWWVEHTENHWKWQNGTAVYNVPYSIQYRHANQWCTELMDKIWKTFDQKTAHSTLSPSNPQLQLIKRPEKGLKYTSDSSSAAAATSAQWRKSVTSNYNLRILMSTLLTIFGTFAVWQC